MINEFCKFGDDCVCLHNESEVKVKIKELEIRVADSEERFNILRNFSKR